MVKKNRLCDSFFDYIMDLFGFVCTSKRKEEEEKPPVWEGIWINWNENDQDYGGWISAVDPYIEHWNTPDEKLKCPMCYKSECSGCCESAVEVDEL
jgi:hypothetical protein